MNRSYLELIEFDSYEDRLNYLMLKGRVGIETFGFDRYLNQALYKSSEWKRLRNDIIIRDNGCDLGVEGYEINDRILIHHIDPITQNDILNRNPIIFDPNNLICCSKRTHDAIHYSTENVTETPLERLPNDTRLW